MSKGFRRARRGGARISMAPEEATVVAALMHRLLDLVGGDDVDEDEEGFPGLAFSDNTAVSDDPVLARLFPDAYGDDRDASADFRRYTEAGLRQGKRAAANVVIETVGDGGDIVLTEDQCRAWLRALNDIRLALGTRLEITEETRLGEVDPNDPRYAVFATYDWLTYLQETLVLAIS